MALLFLVSATTKVAETSAIQAMAAGFLMLAKNGSWGASIDGLLAARRQIPL
jgi:hypothetical protein